MTVQILQIHTDPAELVEAVAVRTAELLRPHLEQLHNPQPDPSPRTRKQAAAFLGVSLTTLNDYERRGYVKGYRVGTRRLYRVEDLQNALQTVRRTATNG